MNNKEKQEIINFNSQWHELMITRYNMKIEWYLTIKLNYLKTFLKFKNILKISYKDFTKYDWKN